MVSGTEMAITSLASPGQHKQLPLQEARSLVADLFEPIAWIYWTDLLVSTTIGYVAFLGFLLLPDAWMQWACFPVCCLALYRVALFVHEIAHFKPNALRKFRIAWSCLVGIPFLLPTFFYDTHREHHRKNSYGTQEDGEYLNFAKRPWLTLFGYLFQPPIIPLLAFIRFGVITPISYLHPKLRSMVISKASALVVVPTFSREVPAPEKRRFWYVQEWGCCSVVWSLVVGTISGLLPWQWLLKLYLVSVTVLIVNTIRTLAAHRFTNNGEPMSYEAQLLDSVNIVQPGLRNWIVRLWAPLGLQYHALHHLFPAIPYHHLALAHKRLMQGLPQNSAYHIATTDSLTRTLLGLVNGLARGTS